MNSPRVLCLKYSVNILETLLYSHPSYLHLYNAAATNILNFVILSLERKINFVLPINLLFNFSQSDPREICLHVILENVLRLTSIILYVFFLSRSG